MRPEDATTIERFFADLSDRLRPLPPERRAEILAELRAHVQVRQRQADVGAQQLLSELGTAQEIAGGGRLGRGYPQVRHRGRRSRSSVLGDSHGDCADAAAGAGPRRDKRTLAGEDPALHGLHRHLRVGRPRLLRLGCPRSSHVYPRGLHLVLRFGLMCEAALRPSLLARAGGGGRCSGAGRRPIGDTRCYGDLPGADGAPTRGQTLAARRNVGRHPGRHRCCRAVGLTLWYPSPAAKDHRGRHRKSGPRHRIPAQTTFSRCGPHGRAACCCAPVGATAPDQKIVRDGTSPVKR